SDGYSGEEEPRHQVRAFHHGRVELGGDLVAAAFAQTGVEAGVHVRARVRGVLLDAAGGGDDPAVHDEEPVLVGHGDPVLDEQGPSPAGQADELPAVARAHEGVVDVLAAHLRVQVDHGQSGLGSGELHHQALDTLPA